MSDFLTRLAGRTLGSVPTVQPIITPMFTPKQAWIGENDPGVVPEGEVSEDSVQQQSIPPIQETQPTFYQPMSMPPTLVPQGNVSSAGASIGSSRLPFSKTPASRHVPPQHKVPNSPQQSKSESSSVPGTLTSSNEQRSTGESPVGVGTNNAHPYATALPLLEQTPTSQPSKRSSSAFEREDHLQGKLLPGDLDPFSEQARGIEIHAEHFQGPPGKTRRSIRASHRDDHLDIPNAFQPGISETQSAMPPRDISPDQRVTEQRRIRPQVSTNRAYHGVSQHNTSSPGVKHVAVGTQFIVPDPASSTIQVTIGRIEVRATPPPPSRSLGQRPPSPVMSLDQYLHQRAKGGDR